jgi:hypothetical protein
MLLLPPLRFWMFNHPHMLLPFLNIQLLDLRRVILVRVLAVNIHLPVRLFEMIKNNEQRNSNSSDNHHLHRHLVINNNRNCSEVILG